MGENWSRLGTVAWSPALRGEVAAIARADGVIAESISVWRFDGAGEASPGRLHVRFDMAAPGLTAPVLRLNDPEPIALAWKDAGDIGLHAPVVFALRADFPRDLSHINPGPTDWPASLCLSRAGLDHIYLRFGIGGIIETLRRWLLDAAAGSLDTTEWHPIPLGQSALGDDAVGILADPAFFQETADRGDAQGFATGIARQLAPRLVRLFSEVYDPTGRGGRGGSPLAEACQAQVTETRRRQANFEHFPWILIWGETDQPVFADPVSMQEVIRQLEEVGVTGTLQHAFATVDAGGATGRRFASMDKAAILVVALRRTRPLLKDIHGLSLDPEARRYELAAFMIRAGTERRLVDPDNRVVRAMPLPLPDPSLFQSISGTPPMCGLGLVGVGSLGSALEELLLRAGLDRLVPIDDDHIESHNLARHAGRNGDLGRAKAEWGRQLASELGPCLPMSASDPGRRRVAFHVQEAHMNVLTAPDDRLREVLAPTQAVLDATADPRVRNRLCAVDHGRRLLRAEIFDSGRLGVLSIGAPGGNPDPFDLYQVLVSLVIHDDVVREWLRRERGGAAGLKEMVLGFGCASATMRLPKFAIDQHATAFMPSLIDVLREDDPMVASGLGLNPLDDKLRPMGWRWFEVPKFVHFTVPEGWSVRISPAALEDLRRMRADRLPDETGGYLFGGWDRIVRRVTVVSATPAPAGTRGTPRDLDLPSVDRCPKAAALLRRSAGRLHLIGTWHSHPDGCALPSPTDLLTISAMALVNVTQGMPTLMLIQSNAPLPVPVFSAEYFAEGKIELVKSEIARTA
ncbi:Mov34/MPN/PAD-1 family protein [Skermanella mucosa]|uniref:Mov34/MPN/PAD-1 family protein n=1 Tax=Skermanella mucosa TaxID=1789672 RepID=UPI00192BF418|nr:Mov34/MPN/PAD-1 family protein [Skermanella mucosa]UEM21337.1 Mov34/MPN/PAD-1 family protein [Skermanella mucosa]